MNEGRAWLLRRRGWIAVLLFALVAASCSVSTGAPEGAMPRTDPPTTTTAASDGTGVGEADAVESETTTSTTVERATPSTSITQPPSSLSDLPGVLAVTDPTGRLIVVRPDGFEATLIDGGDGTSATQPAWSPDGENLAWSSARADERSVAVERLGTGERLDIDAPGPPAFYIQWNPASDELLYLRGSTTSAEVEVWAATPGQPATFVERGAPTFLSWAPSSNRWITHLDNQLLAIRDGAQSLPIDVAATTGGFGAPDWVDDNRVIAVIDEQLSLIDSESGRVVESLGSAPTPDPFRGVRFVFNRPSGALAFHAVGGDAGLVVRTADGSEVSVEGARVPAAWEWSPDGSRLAWLEQLDGGRQMRWHFWSVDTGQELAATPLFTPSPRDARDYLPFFTQFAQSHRRWSPGGFGFAYAGATADGAGIWVQLLTDAPPLPDLVSSGDSVTWSPTGGAGTARTRV